MTFDNIFDEETKCKINTMIQKGEIDTMIQKKVSENVYADLQEYIIKNGLMVYGGFAIYNLIMDSGFDKFKKNSRFTAYYEKSYDIDIFSDNPFHTINEIAKHLYIKNILNGNMNLNKLEVRSLSNNSYINETYSLFANDVKICDVTQNITSNIQHYLKLKNGMIIPNEKTLLFYELQYLTSSHTDEVKRNYESQSKYIKHLESCVILLEYIKKSIEATSIKYNIENNIKHVEKPLGERIYFTTGTQNQLKNRTKFDKSIILPIYTVNSEKNIPIGENLLTKSFNFILTDDQVLVKFRKPTYVPYVYIFDDNKIDLITSLLILSRACGEIREKYYNSSEMTMILYNSFVKLINMTINKIYEGNNLLANNLYDLLFSCFTDCTRKKIVDDTENGSTMDNDKTTYVLDGNNISIKLSQKDNQCMNVTTTQCVENKNCYFDPEVFHKNKTLIIKQGSDRKDKLVVRNVYGTCIPKSLAMINRRHDLFQSFNLHKIFSAKRINEMSRILKSSNTDDIYKYSYDLGTFFKTMASIDNICKTYPKVKFILQNHKSFTHINALNFQQLYSRIDDNNYTKLFVFGDDNIINMSSDFKKFEDQFKRIFKHINQDTVNDYYIIPLSLRHADSSTNIFDFLTDNSLLSNNILKSKGHSNVIIINKIEKWVICYDSNNFVGYETNEIVRHLQNSSREYGYTVYDLKEYVKDDNLVYTGAAIFNVTTGKKEYDGTLFDENKVNEIVDKNLCFMHSMLYVELCLSERFRNYSNPIDQYNDITKYMVSPLSIRRVIDVYAINTILNKVEFTTNKINQLDPETKRVMVNNDKLNDDEMLNQITTNIMNSSFDKMLSPNVIKVYDSVINKIYKDIFNEYCVYIDQNEEIDNIQDDNNNNNIYNNGINNDDNNGNNNDNNKNGNNKNGKNNKNGNNKNNKNDNNGNNDNNNGKNNNNNNDNQNGGYYNKYLKYKNKYLKLQLEKRK